jgi:tRNA A-37 threonylcarbamoyl transferase component Bud32
VLRDRYALDELIGAGGAAKVYRAEDRALDRVVAVKLLDDAIARSADPAGRDRFLTEAKSAARFQHPNLVAVFDAGEDAGELFLVMEYVDGRTLADVIAQRAPLPVDEAVSIAVQVLGGLAAVHANGTIHRDVKPANVLLDGDGRVRLADFGIAKRLDDIDAAVTAAGVLVGTPHYLAPEQATGQPLSPATDVYQVGLVLHEMLTGERAGGSNPKAAAIADPVDPRRLRGDLPDAVAQAVVRATQRDPRRRFDSAEAMVDALTAGAATAPLALSPAGAAGVGWGADAGRTMTMPAGAVTVMLPGGIAQTPAGPPATVVSPPVEVRSPLDPVAARERRNRILLAAAILVLAVLGSLAIAFGGGGQGTLLPGTETTLPATSSVPSEAPVVTSPPTAPPSPTTAPPVIEQDQHRGPDNENDNGNDNGNGKGKKNGEENDD